MIIILFHKNLGITPEKAREILGENNELQDNDTDEEKIKSNVFKITPVKELIGGESGRWFGNYTPEHNNALDKTAVYDVNISGLDFYNEESLLTVSDASEINEFNLSKDISTIVEDPDYTNDGKFSYNENNNNIILLNENKKCIDETNIDVFMDQQYNILKEGVKKIVMNKSRIAVDNKKSKISNNKFSENSKSKLLVLKSDMNDIKENLQVMKFNIMTEKKNFDYDFINLVEKIQRLSLNYDNINEIKENYKKEYKERRRLTRELQNLKGNIRVCCRVRPDVDKTIEIQNFAKLKIQHSFSYSKQKEFTYEFDRIFSPNEDQNTIFNEMKPLILSTKDGYNASIIAYGQTGSGKTHSMEEIYNLSLEELFNNCNKNLSYSFKISFLEIYNEKVKDLLKFNGSPNKSSSLETSQYEIRRDKNGRIFIEDLKVISYIYIIQAFFNSL